jgi:hypothetical protein
VRVPRRQVRPALPGVAPKKEPSTQSENTAAGTADSHQPSTLRGRSLLLARAGWIAVAAVCLGLFVAGIPPYFADLKTACVRGFELCAENRLLTPDEMRELRALGLSAGFYASYIIALSLISTLVWCAVGVIVFWRRSEERMALLAALMLVTFGVLNSGSLQTLAAAFPAVELLPQALTLLGFASTILFIYLFPDGRFVPRWVLFPALAWIANDAVSVFLPDAYEPRWLQWVGFVAFLVPALCAVGSQIYRYRRTSEPVQRQQTKWVVFGIAIGFGGYLVLVLFQGIFFDFGKLGPLNTMFFQGANLLLFLAIPLSIGAAILRSRLWNIDVVINRTLVYGALTVTFVAVYLGGVVLLQTVFRALTGQDSQLAVVISTLIIAALFSPMRRRIQTFIDRRFYRQKYDARKTLDAFSVKLRDETDLGRLREDLISVVRDTLQPASTSLWLRTLDRRSANPGGARE